MNSTERRARLRDALIDAADEAIGRDGLTGLKARALAEAVGCALGAIYNVFPDLDALIFEVNARTLKRLDAALGADLPVHDPEAAMLQLALGYHRFTRGDSRHWRAVFAHQLPEGIMPPDWYLALIGRLFRHIEEPLETLVPHLDANARQSLARTLFSAVHGIVSIGLEEKLGSTPDAVIARGLTVMVRAWVAGLPAATGAPAAA
ncbi:TetR/AcrR family transcriptional regulator [Phreatobacter sp. AB_2022a]|uniref:TetR/AcrR family transcriptional regulator n=1 Tax=Phreatobacter sp. AB_2022a TaxID=3003134 RepID=UPI0022876CBD|nr:TetR/AcrR family transcriptional regulator [Phreatobacter sp. AB_2022a]MCZ0737225.1 TetR/AcrR family transcriptional regulator [Phreatobacter sp. AB_2022a]